MPAGGLDTLRCSDFGTMVYIIFGLNLVQLEKYTKGMTCGHTLLFIISVRPDLQVPTSWMALA